MAEAVLVVGSLSAVYTVEETGTFTVDGTKGIHFSLHVYPGHSAVKMDPLFREEEKKRKFF